MDFKPHILQKCTIVIDFDEYGRSLVENEDWGDVCGCRCDQSSVDEISTDSGTTEKVSWHVVCEGPRISVSAGQQVRCKDVNGTLICEGRVKKIHNLNYLPYAELWI